MSCRPIPVMAAVLALVVAPAASAADLHVSIDRTTIATRLGHTFVLHSTIENRGAAPAAGLVAHLNVLSLRGDVYVDPEDWSSHRTRYLPPIRAHGAVTLPWKLNAVSPGRLGVYVAVLPRSGSGSPVTGPTVAVAIADRKTLNSGGILPLALGLPAAVGLLALVLRLRRRRLGRVTAPNVRARG